MDPKINHPFTTPEHYFDDLKESILVQTPGYLLSKQPKTNIHAVPDGFFEEQYNDILNKKKSQEHHLFPVFHARKTLAWVGTSVMTVLLVLFTYSYFGTEEINTMLTKESGIIQSNVTDMEDELSKSSQNSIVSPAADQVLQEEVTDELILESDALEESL